MGFKVKIWGVRGSIACPTANHLAFGGNTSCIEVSVGGTKIILDAGTGIRSLGTWFLRKDVHRATILLSHTHWDHINGFPFFVPAFQDGYSFKIMAGHLADREGIQEVLAGQMSQPMFPVPIGAMLSHSVSRTSAPVRPSTCPPIRRSRYVPRRSTTRTARPATASSTPANRSAT